jgi:two-component system response regulator DctR/two-component system response regulator FixJ
MPNTPVTIAIVDDDDSIRHALGNLLMAAEFDVLPFASAEDFLEALDGRPIGCLIADINLPGMSGVALTEALAAAGRAIPTVLITARDDATTISLLGRAAHVPHLHKPFTDHDLFSAIRHVLPPSRGR